MDASTIVSTSVSKFENQKTHYRSVSNFDISDRTKILATITLVLWISYILLLLLCGSTYAMKKIMIFTMLKQKSASSKPETRRKVIMTFFVTLKIFYTFLFTLTTLLTLILTLRDYKFSASVSRENYSIFSNQSPRFYQLKSLPNCSVHLTTKLTRHLNKFSSKRLENVEICYNSAQSMQNESKKLVTIYYSKLNTFANRIWRPYIAKFAHENLIFRDMYSKLFDDFFQSKWFRHVDAISNLSKTIFQENFDNLFFRKYNNDPTRAGKTTSFLNLTVLSPTFLSVIQVQKNFNNIFKGTEIYQSKHARPPITLISYAYRFRYMEKIAPCNKESEKLKLSRCHSPRSVNENNNKFRLRFSNSFTEILLIRMVMLLLDFMLIVHRSYRLYADVKNFWIGKKAFVEYKVYSQYSPIANSEILIEDESSFKQLISKTTPWTKRQNIHCFNSLDLILMIQIIIFSIILTGLLVCLVSRESSIFLLPLLQSSFISESRLYLPNKLKFMEMKPKKSLTDKIKGQTVNVMKDIITYHYNVTFRFNHYEKNFVSQYMWEQCFTERIYESLSKDKNVSIHIKLNQPGYCDMPLPQSSVKYMPALCNFQRQENLVYFYYLRSKNTKEKPFYLYLFRYYLVECGIILYTMILSALAVLGMLKISRKIILKNSISQFQKCVLIVPQSSDSLQQSSMESSFLINQGMDTANKRNSSRNLYSCQRLDTRV